MISRVPGRDGHLRSVIREVTAEGLREGDHVVVESTHPRRTQGRGTPSGSVAGSSAVGGVIGACSCVPGLRLGTIAFMVPHAESYLRTWCSE